MQWVGIKKMQR